MLFKIRKKFARFQEFLARPFVALPFSANFYSLLSVVLSVIYLFLMMQRNYLLAIVAAFFAFFFDIVDGYVARAKNQQSNLGAYLDTLGDRLTEGLAIIGLYFTDLPNKELLFFLMFFSFLTSFSKAAATEKKLFKDEEQAIKAMQSIFDFPERSLMLLAILLLIFFEQLLLANNLLIVACFLTAISFLQRTLSFVKNAEKAK